MNIVGFSGSPRKSGSTAWAVNKILEGATTSGAGTQLFRADEYDIRPCQGCNACNKGEGCALQDDMQKIYLPLKTANAIVLGLPLYMAQMSGQAKVFLDRLYAVFKPRFSPLFREEFAGKKVVLVWTQGNPDADMFKEYLDYIRRMFDMLALDVVDAVVIAGTRNAHANEQNGLGDRLIQIGEKLTDSEGQ